MKLLGAGTNLFIELSLLLIVSACSKLMGEAPSNQGDLISTQINSKTPTQLITSSNRLAINNICLVKDFHTIQTQGFQGDIIAWSPSDDQIAFVRPQNSIWGWYLGELIVYEIYSDKSVLVSEDKFVFGDLTWSPDGNYLGFIVLDQNQKTYFAKLVGLNDYSNIDVSGQTINERTDDWVSRKGIRKWDSITTMVITSSCGVDCVRAYSFDLVTQQLTPLGESRKQDDDSLLIDNEYFSPNGIWQIEIDSMSNALLTSTVNKETYMFLETMPIDEIKWSSNSRYFALRTKDHVMIYEPLCIQK